MSGIERIAAERKRQVEKEGWTPEHDDEHADGSLALAAVCYATPVQLYELSGGKAFMTFQDPWPESWDEDWDKRPQKTPTNAQRIRMLEKAGALIAAEIDRLLRMTPN